jgi:pyruvate/2-oxoglutarate dehydrogenase complex dihydrolipoamide dehydrogenase (E3) component
MSRREYDVAVIGGGAAGLTSAGMAAHLGARTLFVEARRFGGECTWSGCIPSKALVRAARLLGDVRRGAEYGILAGEARVDAARLWQRVRDLRQRIYDEADDPRHYERFGAVTLTGRARFVDPRTLAIARAGGADEKVTADRFVLCTGSKPAVPRVEGLSSVPYHTNETIFELEHLPRSLAVLGGGPIGCELGQAFRTLGCAVTLFQSAPRLLPRDLPEISEAVARRFRSDGIRLHLGVRVERVEQGGEGIIVRAPGVEVAVEALLVATGRVPATEGLGLDHAGVRHDAAGIAVDAHCRTSAPHIFAAGDVTAAMKFTHLAEHMAKVAVGNALLRWPFSIDYDNIPWVTFVSPEVAHAGLTPGAVAARGIRAREYRFPFSRIDRALTDGAEEGSVRILARQSTGRIYAADIVGQSAGEMIGEYALAIRNRLSMRQIADTVHPYPTYVLGNRRAADQWYAHKASPRLVRLLQRVFGYRGKVPAPLRGDEVL